MEKTGEIKEGITPLEKTDENVKRANQKILIEELENHTTKRLADTVENKLKK